MRQPDFNQPIGDDMKNPWNMFDLSSPILLDGAWGTQLQERGMPVGQSSENWNLTRPDLVGEVASAYVDAGSQIILTNTFCGNRLMLERHGHADRTADINRIGAEISVAAAKGRARVFGSMGPCGKMVFAGEVEQAELDAAFHEQASAMQSGGVDGLVIETMADIEEACAAVRAAKRTGLPVVASMVFDSGTDKDRNMMGTTPEQAAERLVAVGADAIGANCGQGPAGYLSICHRLHASSGLPVWIKPNAGFPELLDGKPVYRMKPDVFAEVMSDIIRAGATFIGGCCGTSPSFIRSLRNRMGN